VRKVDEKYKDYRKSTIIRLFLMKKCNNKIISMKKCNNKIIFNEKNQIISFLICLKRKIEDQQMRVME
jgi:hypothetical protein